MYNQNCYLNSIDYVNNSDLRDPVRYLTGSRSSRRSELFNAPLAGIYKAQLQSILAPPIHTKYQVLFFPTFAEPRLTFSP